MAISSRHPSYSEFLEDWTLCRDSYRGERIVKSKTTQYLPATAGQIADGMDGTNAVGRIAYNSYLTRAVFPEYMSSAVETMIGLMWSKPPTIELPDVMKPMMQNATRSGESLEQLLRRVNEQQLVTGRIGLLADMPENPDPTHVFPYIATYNCEHIINWDVGTKSQVGRDSLNLVVLDESEFVREDDFVWKHVDKYRVLVLGDLIENEEVASYRVGLFEGTNATFNEFALKTPSIRGRVSEQIPFVFINTKDITVLPDDPPLAGLARLCMAIYRGEADYRQSLYLQGQDTLVVIGAAEDDAHRIGAGAALNLPMAGDAKFIGVSADGLGEQRQCLENDKAIAANKAGDLIDIKSRAKESGESLKTRVAAQTATLTQIARSGAEGLQSLLRIVAEWMGANPEQVIVTPNLDFTNTEMEGKTLADIMTAKTLGAPISQQSVHRLMHTRGLTEMTFEEEMLLLENESPLTDGGTEAGGNPEEDE
jgi:hypothetical protein